jgi:branched-chain amino acid transport system permease protein
MSDGNDSLGAPAALTGTSTRLAESSALARLLSARQGGFALLLAIVLLAPLFMDGLYHYDLAVLIGINAIIVIGLNVLVGYAGQISLGHAGFFGLGAYTSAILTARYDWPGLLALAASAAFVGLVAFIVAKPILRLRGYYLAMATLGLGMIIYLVLTSESWLTGGPDGMDVPPLEVFGRPVMGEQTWYWIVAMILLLTYWLALNLIDSPVGRALRAVHGSEIAAATAGVDATGYKVLIFVVSSALAAAMGGLYAFYSGFITPSSAGFLHSIHFVVMVVFGGMASIVGSLVGAIVLTLLPQMLTVFADYDALVYGLILMLVMIFMPKGLVPTLASWLRRSR